MSSGFSLSYLSRALTSMLLFAGGVSVSAQTLYPSSSNLYASSFMDPFGTQGGVLNINVYTPCLANLIVHVHLPQVYDSSEATATLVSPNGDFGPITVSGYSQNTNNVIPTTASISWSNADKTLTFSDFLDGKSSRTFIRNTPVTGAVWTNVNFDIPDGMFGTSAFPMILELLPGGPPGATDLKIQLISDGHFSVEQLNRVCPTLPPTTPPPCPGCVHGDPVFAGFQGQNFQFQGLPDEHFNLVSSPNVTVNSHFVYLASGGKCDYTDTPCWTHPGTYMDVLGFQIADSHIKLVAGTHEAGLRIWADDIELTRGERVTDFNATGMVHFHHSGRVDIQTELMNFKIVNSDMFMNIQVSLNEPQLLRVGSAKHTITDKVMCKANSETSHHQLVESIVAAKYPVTTPLHGLIGQTWRNVKVCGNDWMGTTEDYLVSELFANDNHYNYFTW